MTAIYVKPVEGRLVRDPLTQQVLPAHGQRVVSSTFWQRRIVKGDVVEVAEPAPARTAPAPKKDA